MLFCQRMRWRIICEQTSPCCEILILKRIIIRPSGRYQFNKLNILFIAFHCNWIGEIRIEGIFKLLIIGDNLSQCLLVQTTVKFPNINHQALTVLQTVLSSYLYLGNTVQISRGADVGLNYERMSNIMPFMVIVLPFSHSKTSC